MLSRKHINQFAIFYISCFAISYGWILYYGLNLSTYNPIFFVNKLDISNNLLWLTNIQNTIISQKWICILLDLIYGLLPLLLLFTVYKEKKISNYVAIALSLYNLMYSLLLSSFTFLSIHMFISWIFIPLLFCGQKEKDFYYSLQSLRIIFIVIFFSTGLWKIVNEGLYNMEQMSAILFKQHISYISNNQESFIGSIILFFIKHKTFSFALYLIGFILEFSFVIGLFTKRFDKYLMFALALFIILDYSIMFINYFHWLVFIGVFYFSKFKLSEEENHLSS